MLSKAALPLSTRGPCFVRGMEPRQRGEPVVDKEVLCDSIAVSRVRKTKPSAVAGTSFGCCLCIFKYFQLQLAYHTT